MNKYDSLDPSPTPPTKAKPKTKKHTPSLLFSSSSSHLTLISSISQTPSPLFLLYQQKETPTKPSSFQKKPIFSKAPRNRCAFISFKAQVFLLVEEWNIEDLK
ncbi:hypothetical protein VNO80_03658 [Phaseolus coccineus]|uniref:Uncharacterized protein n=1 Tax=Phaseolus coccineus TaxID=3886 RepID=A0AAN9NTK7_PHACN